MEPWKKNLYIIWVAQVFSLMGFGFGLPFLPFYLQELGVTDPERLRVLVGIASAIPAALMGIMALVWGRLSDTYGRKPMMLRALFAGGFIVMGLAFARNVATVLILRAIQGLFAGSMTAAITLVAAGTPRKRLSYALGLIASSNFIGFSLGPLVGGFTAELFGYRVSFFIGGVLLFGAFLLVLFGAKELSEKDLPPEQEEPVIVKKSKRAASWDEQETVFSLKMIFRQPFILGFILIFSMRFISSFMQPFLPLYFQEIIGRLEGASAITGIVTGLTGIATALAGVTLVRLGDSYDKLGLIKIYLLLATLFSIPLFILNDLLFFTVFLVATRYFMGAVEPLLHSMIGMQTPPAQRGIVFGSQTFVGSMGWFISPLIGSSISVYLGIRYIFLFHSIGIALSFIIILVLNRRAALIEPAHPSYSIKK